MIKMIAWRLLFAVTSCLSAGPSWAQAVAPPSSGLVKLGQTVEIIDDQGRETHGKVTLTTLKSISLDRDGLVTQIPLEHITQIAGTSATAAASALSPGSAIAKASGIAG